MASYSEAPSRGTQHVIDEIAARRHRIHFLKDRRISMEKQEMRGPPNRQSSYKAWGRTKSQKMLEHLLTPKEINLLWGWFGPTMKVEDKHNLVHIDELMDELIMVSAFSSYDDAREFIESITIENEGCVSFSEITKSISDFEVSEEHVHNLIQFCKKLRSIKKEKKKRPTSAKPKAKEKVESPTPMLKSKSENMATVDLPTLRTPTVQKRKGGLDVSPIPPRRKDSMRQMLRSTSSMSNASLQDISPSPPLVISSKGLAKVGPSLSRESTNNSIAIIDEPTSPLVSPRKLEPLNTHSPRPRENKEIVRRANTVTDIHDSKELSQINLRSQGMDSNVKMSNKVNDPQAKPAQSLEGLRRRYSRGLTRMSSSELEVVEDASTVKDSVGTGAKPSRSKRKSRRISVNDMALKNEQPATKVTHDKIKAEVQQRSSFRRESTAQRDVVRATHADEDEDIAIKSPIDSRRVDCHRNSLRHNRPTMRQTKKSTDVTQRRNSSTQSKNNDKEMATNAVNVDVKSNDQLHNLRRRYSSQLVKMSSCENDATSQGSATDSVNKEESLSPVVSACVTDHTPEGSIRGGGSAGGSFSFSFDNDNSPDITRFNNMPSKNTSFGDTIYLRSNSSDLLDI